MANIISKGDLQAKLRGVEIEEFEHELAGIGTVRCRGLSRKQAASVQGKGMPPEEMDAALLSFGVIDPRLSAEEWMEISTTIPAGLLEPLSQRIAAASGMRMVDPKAAYVRFRDES